MSSARNAQLRGLPAVHEVVACLTPICPESSKAPQRAAQIAREVIDELRRRIQNGEDPQDEVAPEAIARQVATKCLTSLRPTLRTVINATGVLLHTNLGRAPLAAAAAQAAAAAGGGYLNLEMDLETGRRSSRPDAVREWLRQLLGAESATVVNNNAAATVLVLRALARDREVIVSRGELVEIGGSFRIPEIMGVSGAILREVGTTNITRIGDYAAAISERTAALLRVHASNYRIVGHTEAPTLPELVKLGRERNLPVIDDTGSGAFIDFTPWGLTGEPLPRASLDAGADLVLFSGDKLLGGPQAGIIAGREALISRIEKDPLMRAFRVDKMTLAALEATLRLYLQPAQARQEIPLLRAIAIPMEELRRRGDQLLGALAGTPGLTCELRDSAAYVGGGSLPGQGLPSFALRCRHETFSATSLAQRLRVGEPAVVARIENEWVWFDLRTIATSQDESVAAALKAAVG